MREAHNPLTSVPNEADRLSGLTATFTHPDEVVESRLLSVAEKRAILAAWASDAHAVPNVPAMRQLDSGAIVNIDTVLGALRALDAAQDAVRLKRAKAGSAPRSRATVLQWRRSLRGRDPGDDDDPPPCPAAALPPGLARELRRRREASWALAAA